MSLAGYAFGRLKFKGQNVLFLVFLATSMRALGQPPSERLRAGLRDDRALVRRAFSRFGVD